MMKKTPIDYAKLMECLESNTVSDMAGLRDLSRLRGTLPKIEIARRLRVIAGDLVKIADEVSLDFATFDCTGNLHPELAA